MMFKVSFVFDHAQNEFGNPIFVEKMQKQGNHDS